jgi:hypothetical protein
LGGLGCMGLSNAQSKWKVSVLHLWKDEVLTAWKEHAFGSNQNFLQMQREGNDALRNTHDQGNIYFLTHVPSLYHPNPWWACHSKSERWGASSWFFSLSVLPHSLESRG